MGRHSSAASLAARHLRSPTSTASEARVHGGLAACVVALVSCVVISLVHDPAADASAGDEGGSGPVEITAEPACVPESPSGEYTSGAIVLSNPGGPVEITDVRLKGAGDLRLAQSYAVPATDGGALGSSAQWPPAKEQLQAAPGWLSRVKAVGAERLGPTGSSDAATWNLVLHLSGTTGDGAGYSSVLVDYRVGGESWTASSDGGLKVRTSC